MEKRLMRTMSMLAAVLMMLGVIYAVSGTAKAYAAKNGLVKKNGQLYYYKNGKKVKNQTVKVKGRYYYFSSKGRGFYSLRKKKGNQAVAKVIDNVTFKKGMSKKSKLKKCYKYIVKMSYLIEEVPDTSASKWYFPVAKNMAYNRGGKCYGFASLTASCAKALGFKNVILHKGLAKRKAADRMTEHCWVTLNGKVLDASYDNSYWYRTGQPKTPTFKFFLRTYTGIKSNPYNFRVSYKYVQNFTL